VQCVHDAQRAAPRAVPKRYHYYGESGTANGGPTGSPAASVSWINAYLARSDTAGRLETLD